MPPKAYCKPSPARTTHHAQHLQSAKTSYLKKGYSYGDSVTNKRNAVQPHSACKHKEILRNHNTGGAEFFRTRPGIVTEFYSPIFLKKSLPLSSTRMKAGKSSTRIFQTASMPSSGYSTHSMDLMLSCARMAAGPPIEPR